MNKRLFLRILFFAAALAVMVFIFVMSSKNADASSAISKSFTRRLLGFILKGFGDMTPQRQEAIIGGLQFIIRKTAHAFIYTVLGVLLTCGFLTFECIKKAKRFFVPLALGALYSVSDEIHQLFVQGRSCELRDVCIDSLGVAIGILLVLLVLRLFKNKIKI